MSSEDRFEIEWHWEGHLRVAILPDGATVRASKAIDLREKVQSRLAEQGVDARYLYFRQIGDRQGRRTPRRQRSRPQEG